MNKTSGHRNERLEKQDAVSQLQHSRKEMSHIIATKIEGKLQKNTYNVTHSYKV